MRWLKNWRQWENPTAGQMIVVVVMCAIIGILGTSQCTSNQRARNWGGTQTIQLDQGQKLANLTWKENSLWVLTRATKPGETPETYTFQQHSSWGIIQGKVVIQEK